MKITPVEQLVDQANREINVLQPKAALAQQEAGDAVLVDIRDIRELDRMGKVTNAVHAPRGMLEFWFDPASKYHREVFADHDKNYVLFCAMGWRSALATKTLKDMCFENVAHVNGGFEALKEAGAEINEPDK